jgi:hypothetical protein
MFPRATREYGQASCAVRQVDGLVACDPRCVEVERNCETETPVLDRADPDTCRDARAAEIEVATHGDRSSALWEDLRAVGGRERGRPSESGSLG